jgi:hypothetical protein
LRFFFALQGLLDSSVANIPQAQRIPKGPSNIMISEGAKYMMYTKDIEINRKKENKNTNILLFPPGLLNTIAHLS